MFFIGQNHIMPTLGDNLIYTYKTKQGLAILFRGPSGYGKTELAKRSCNFLVGRDYQYCLGNYIKFNENTWVHFIDEIHLMTNPETLYPVIDEGRYVFVFATNFDSILPEALTNRCKNYIFTEYSNQELVDIFKFHQNLQFTEPVIKHIIEISNRNPRVMIKTYLHNTEVHFFQRVNDFYNKSDQEIIEIIDNIHGVRDNLDEISRQYLRVLRELGGRASIKLLVAALRLDENSIKYTIEPGLMFRNLIKITSRGRELCQ